MDRGIPTPSKLITKKVNDRNMQIHLAKLNSMKSTLSREAPQQFSHLKSNKKKQQVYEDRLNIIEKDNRTLLNKLTSIMKTSHTQTANLNQTATSFAQKSLNRDFRKRELVKITMDNQDFLKRLQNNKPVYNRNNWEHDNKQHLAYLKNISEYPLTLVKSITPSAAENQSMERQTLKEPSVQISPKVNTANPLRNTSKQSSLRVRSQPTKKNRPEKLNPVDVSSVQKHLLYQTKKKIGFSTYLIHIYLHNNTFNIIASNNDRSDLKTYTASLAEADELITRYGESYEQLADRIRFKGPAIVFENESMSMDGQTHGEITETPDEHEHESTFKNQPDQDALTRNSSNTKSEPQLLQKNEEKKETTQRSEKSLKNSQAEKKESASETRVAHQEKDSESQPKIEEDNDEEQVVAKADLSKNSTENLGEEFITKAEKEDSETKTVTHRSDEHVYTNKIEPAKVTESIQSSQERQQTDALNSGVRKPESVRDSGNYENENGQFEDDLGEEMQKEQALEGSDNEESLKESVQDSNSNQKKGQIVSKDVKENVADVPQEEEEEAVEDEFVEEEEFYEDAN